MKTVYVSVFPTVLHRHDDGEIVSVRLKRQRGQHSVECPGCDTLFVYRKPRPSNMPHYPSPLLRNAGRNFDPGDGSG